jgi:hypothetical protein
VGDDLVGVGGEESKELELLGGKVHLGTTHQHATMLLVEQYIAKALLYRKWFG